MARPARLYDHPAPGSDSLSLINVNFFSKIRVLNDGGTPPWVLRIDSPESLAGAGGVPLFVRYTTEAEALAAAEVWRARVDDAP